MGAKNFFDYLIIVRKTHIPNLRPLIPFLNVEKIVVVGGGWVVVVVVVETYFSVQLKPTPS